MNYSDLLWACRRVSDLSSLEMYQILQMRNKIFVVEQQCIYQDCDERDLVAFHLTAKANDILLAYSRLLPPGTPYPGFASIGRVAVEFAERRNGLGKMLMLESIKRIHELFGDISIKISAQYHLRDFYSQLGFVISGEIYLEDGIPHISMVK